ncbi:MAG: flagellar basal-body MS-ring/collar protein FliF [Actinomycetaceae bacterium]|nr:flagellar basal-body MS-ring/collar protein FliF [Actinomycetaceae bacterium]
MPPAITGALDRAKTTVSQFSIAQRTLAAIGVAMLVLGCFALYTWISSPDYKPLYSGLSDKDASAITTQLSAEGIKYQTSEGGVVSVPADKLYDARMKLAAANLPEETTAGYAILDSLGVTASDFQQNMAKKRALEGELAKTIRTMNGVEAATVQLAIPEKSVFVDNVADPTASVFLTLKKGTELEKKAVDSIVNFVSASIPDMKPKNVTVVDAAGVTLSNDGSSNSAAALEYEKRIRAAILDVVEPLVGAGNARVAVTAKLTEDVVERTSKTYTEPEGGVMSLNSSTQNERYNGSGQIVGGVLGPDNIGNPNNLTGQGVGGNYQTDQNVTNNAINEVVEHALSQPGGVASQAVSVVVNQETARRLDMTALRDIVVAASNINVERGDIVNVSRMPFDATAAEAAQKAADEAAAAAEAEERATMIRQAIIAGVILLLLLIIAAIARRRAKKREREALDLGELDQMPEPYMLTPPEEEPLELPSAEEYEEEFVELEQPKPDPAMLRLEAKRQEIADLAIDKPGKVAEQLRMWMGAR